MSQRTRQRVYRVTTFITFTSLVFYLFFQVNKNGPFRDLNPFGQDPYDAIGSLAIQAALLIGLLTYARALRLHDDPTQVPKLPLILRGNILVLGIILVTLIADAIAIRLNGLSPSYWGNILLGELAAMGLLTLSGGVVLIVGFRSIPIAPPPDDLTLADALDDLWTLVRVPIMRAQAVLPAGLVAWVVHFNSDWLFGKVQWLNPRFHAWRFAGSLGLLVGLGLILTQLQEGLPPSLEIGLLIAGIFIGVELSATLAGFALLGRYLGLRASCGKRS